MPRQLKQRSCWDAKEKEDLRVVLMDEVRDAVYEHLYKYPLYSGINLAENQENTARSRLSLLIAGRRENRPGISQSCGSGADR